MARGGARPGAGRPRTRDKYVKPVEEAELKIVGKLQDIVDNLLILANGVTVQEVDNLSGETKVYKKPPDRAANQYLLDRIAGKPVERQETEGDTAVTVRFTGVDVNI